MLRCCWEGWNYYASSAVLVRHAQIIVTKYQDASKVRACFKQLVFYQTTLQSSYLNKWFKLILLIQLEAEGADGMKVSVGGQDIITGAISLALIDPNASRTKIRVNIKMQSKTFSTCITRFQTVYCLKTRLWGLYGIPIDLQQLFYQGRQLQNEMTLEESGFCLDSCMLALIDLAIRRDGGMKRHEPDHGPDEDSEDESDLEPDPDTRKKQARNEKLAAAKLRKADPEAHEKSLALRREKYAAKKSANPASHQEKLLARRVQRHADVAADPAEHAQALLARNVQHHADIAADPAAHAQALLALQVQYRADVAADPAAHAQALLARNVQRHADIAVDPAAHAQALLARNVEHHADIAADPAAHAQALLALQVQYHADVAADPAAHAQALLALQVQRHADNEDNPAAHRKALLGKRQRRQDTEDKNPDEHRKQMDLQNQHKKDSPSKPKRKKDFELAADDTLKEVEIRDPNWFFEAQRDPIRNLMLFAVNSGHSFLPVTIYRLPHSDTCPELIFERPARTPPVPLDDVWTKEEEQSMLRAVEEPLRSNLNNLLDKLEEQVITPEFVDKKLEDFKKVINLEAFMPSCACCNVRDDFLSTVSPNDLMRKPGRDGKTPLCRKSMDASGEPDKYTPRTRPLPPYVKVAFDFKNKKGESFFEPLLLTPEEQANRPTAAFAQLAAMFHDPASAKRSYIAKENVYVDPNDPSRCYFLSEQYLLQPAPSAGNGDVDSRSVPDVVLCRLCYSNLLRKKAPVYSMKLGFDYGNMVGAPFLSILERTLLAKNIVCGIVVKLKRWNTVQRKALTGHIIGFPSSGPVALASLANNIFPWHGPGILEFLRVSFVGPKHVADWCLKILLLPGGPLHAEVRPLLFWLKLLQLVHPMYSSTVLPSDEIIAEYLKETSNAILARAQIVTSKIAKSMDSVITADIAGVRTLAMDDEQEDTDDPDKDVCDPDCDRDEAQRARPVFLDDPSLPGRLNLILESALIMDGSRPGECLTNDIILRNLHKVLHPDDVIEDTANVPIESVRGEHPINEYGGNDVYLYGGFPYFFIYGKGINLNSSALVKPLARHLLLQGSCRFAHDARFQYLIFNQLHRHTAARTVAFHIRNNTDVIRRFIAITRQEGFRARLAKAARDPESDHAKELITLLSPLIANLGKSLPYSNAARKSSFSHFLGSNLRFGGGFWFLTLAIDDKNHTLCLRGSKASGSNNGFPAEDCGFREALLKNEQKYRAAMAKAEAADEKSRLASLAAENATKACSVPGIDAIQLSELQKAAAAASDLAKAAIAETLIADKELDTAQTFATANFELPIPIDDVSLLKLVADNPVSATMLFKRLFDAILSTLLGIQNPSADAKCTQNMPINHPNRRGILGIVTDFLSNIECNGRGVLHFHAVVVAIINSYIIQHMVHSPILMQKLAKIIDSMVCSELPIKFHLETIMRKDYGIPAEETNQIFVIPFSPLSEPAKFDNHVFCCACHTQIHLSTHTNSCVKYPLQYCRYCKGSVFAIKTAASLVEIIDLDPIDDWDPQRRARRSKKGMFPTEHDFKLISPVPEPPPPRPPTYDNPIRQIDTRPITLLVKRRGPDAMKAEFDRLNDGPELSADFDMIECLDHPLLKDVDDSIKQRIRDLTREQRYELKKRILEGNMWATEFSKPLLAASGCNEALYPMGTGTSAKAIFIYICLYVCKHSTQICSILTLLYDAKQHVDKYPSTANDPGPERDTRHFFQRVLNRISGSAEYSGMQVNAHWLGLDAEFKMHLKAYVFAESAINYVLRHKRLLPDIADDDALDGDYLPGSDSDHSFGSSGVYSSDSDDGRASESDCSVDLDAGLPPLLPIQEEETILPRLALTDDAEFGPHGVSIILSSISEEMVDESDPMPVDSEVDDSDDEPADIPLNFVTSDVGGEQTERKNRFENIAKRMIMKSGSVQVLLDKNGKPGVPDQAEDFHFKPSVFSAYSLIEYACTTKRVLIKSKSDETDPIQDSDHEDNEDDDADGVDSDDVDDAATNVVQGASPMDTGVAPDDAADKNIKRGRGRPSLLKYDFKTEHRFHGLNGLVIQSQHAIPIIISRTPPFPGPRPIQLTDVWRAKARRFAAHILTVYRPWDGEDGLPKSLTWMSFCEWYAELQASDSIIDRTRHAFVTIAAHNLRYNNAAAKLLRLHRASKATRWKDLAAKLRPKACFFHAEKDDKDVDVPSDATYREMQLAMNELLHMASPKSSSDERFEAMLKETRKSIEAVFPVMDRTGDAAHSDMPGSNDPDNDPKSALLSCLNCFDVENVKRVHEENLSVLDKKASMKKPSNSSSRSSRKKRQPKSNKPSGPDNDTLWSEQQQAILDCVSDYLQRVAVWREHGSLPDDLPIAPKLLLFGGPGTYPLLYELLPFVIHILQSGVGKTTVLTEITKMCEEYSIPLSCAAYTGVAAGSLRYGVTIHSGFGIPIDISANSDENLDCLSKERLNTLLADLEEALSTGVPFAAIIDEISMITGIVAT